MAAHQIRSKHRFLRVKGDCYLPACQIDGDIYTTAISVFTLFSLRGGECVCVCVFYVEVRWPRVTKIKHKKPTEVPVPGKVQIREPIEWDKCLVCL